MSHRVDGEASLRSVSLTTSLALASGSGTPRLRALLRGVYRGLKHLVARAELCACSLRFGADAIRRGELQSGDVATVEAAFRAAGSQPSAADLQAQARQQTGIVVAWLGPRPVGIGFVEWPGPRDVELRQRWPGVPEIYRLWVMPRYRTVGIGAALVKHIESQALGRGLSRIAIGVHDKNHRARALYLRLAYQPDPQGYFDRYLAPASDGAPARLISQPATFLIKTLADPAA